MISSLVHTVSNNTYTTEISLDFRRRVYITFPDHFIPMIDTYVLTPLRIRAF